MFKVLNVSFSIRAIAKIPCVLRKSFGIILQIDEQMDVVWKMYAKSVHFVGTMLRMTEVASNFVNFRNSSNFTR